MLKLNVSIKSYNSKSNNSLYNLNALMLENTTNGWQQDSISLMP